MGLGNATGQQSETIVESLSYLLYPECTSSRRRQFDGQRNAVEPSADGRGRRHEMTIRHEVRFHSLRPLDEELDRSVSQQVVLIRDIGCRNGERRHPIDPLSLSHKRLPTCRDDTGCRIGVQ